MNFSSSFRDDPVAGPLGRKFFAVLCCIAFVPWIVLGTQAVVSKDDELLADLQHRVETRAFATSDAVNRRVLEAQLLVDKLLAASKGDVDRLRKSAAAQKAFAGVTVRRIDGGDPRLAQRLLLGDADGWRVARGIVNGRAAFLVSFAIEPQWLWQDLVPGSGGLIIAARDGSILAVAGKVPAAVRSLLEQRLAQAVAPRAAPLAWQAAGNEWRGLRVPVGPIDNGAGGTSWWVASFEEVPAFGKRAVSAVGPLLAVLALTLFVAAFAAARAARRYGLALKQLENDVQSIGQRVPARSNREAPVEFAGLARAIDAAAAHGEETLQAQETLGEIDRLLLGAAALEPIMDAILNRVLVVTKCQSVGITLFDADSPDHGRVFMAAAGLSELPVNRIEFDPEMAELLCEEGQPLTVARCEEIRHSFLVPLRKVGSEFFWVWPVKTSGQLAAVLAVGFRDAPQSNPRHLNYCQEFATRLAIALSKTARDEHLYRQAHFDPLTSLPNRLLFRDRLAQDLASAVQAGSHGALLYVDLDHFKRVNDTVGHAAGDQLLAIIAQRLRSAVKEGDTVARLAGDEFTVILRNVVDSESAAIVAERIVDAVKAPVKVGGRDHFVTASVGITMFPDDGNTIDELMRNADGAMYRAKNHGRGRALFYDRQLVSSIVAVSQSGLHRALRRREFSLYYQPQFRLDDGGLAGIEALLRWQTPREGAREPKDFIPAAEATGLIVDIGGWVLDAACAQFAAWREQGIAPPRLAINVSAYQLRYAEFPRSVRRVLEKYGIPPAMIELEITESVFADEAAGAAMAQLATYGLRIALDDFGTGYSSLNYLRQYPIQVVKIDRSFLEEVPVNPASATLAATIITMAHALGKQVVAEGVETEEQMRFLRERGCDLAQGFYLSRPQPAENITSMLAKEPGSRDDVPLREAG